MATSNILSNAFISYSRRDADFVNRLYSLFVADERDIWIDFEDINLSDRWWSAIEEGIRRSDMMIIILSDEWLASPVCHKEALVARQLNKRIIPLVLEMPTADVAIRRAVERYDDDTNLRLILDMDNLPQVAQENYQTISQLNFIFYENQEHADALAKSYAQLIETMNLDIDYVREHTTYLIQAQNWIDRETRDEFLLIGAPAVNGYEWLQSALNNEKDPAPTDMQRDFIEKSMQIDQRRRRTFARMRYASITFFALVLVAIVVTGFTLRNLSLANAERQQAENEIVVLGSTLTPLPQTEQSILTTLDAGEWLVETSVADVTESSVTLTAVQGEVIVAQENAERSAAQSRSLELANLANQARLIGEYDQALAFAYEANVIDNPPFEAQMALVDAVADTVVRDRIDIAPNDSANDPPLRDAVHAADGSLIVYEDFSRFGNDNTTLILRSTFDDTTRELVLGNATPDLLALSADGQCLLAILNVRGGGDDLMGIYDTTIGDWLWQTELETSSLISVGDINEDCTQIALRSETGVDLIDAQENELIGIIEIDIPEDDSGAVQFGAPTIDNIQFAPGNDYLIATSTTMFWRVDTDVMKIKYMVDTNIFIDDITFAPDGAIFGISGGSQFAFTSDFPIALFEGATGNEVGRLADEHQDRVTATTFSRDGRFLLSASNDRTIIVWDVANQALFTQYINGHSDRVGNLFLLDEDTLMSMSWDGEIITWDISQASYVQTLSWHIAQVNDLILLPDQSLAFSASDDQQVVLWDLLTGQPARIYNGQAFPVADIDFLADEDLLVSVGYSEFPRESILFWDFDEPNSVSEIGATDSGRAITFIPNRQIYAVGEGDSIGLVPYGERDAGSILVGSLDDSFNGHSGLVVAMDAHPDGDYLVSSDRNGRMIVWELRTNIDGFIRHRLDGHSGAVNDVLYDDSGTRIVSGGDDNLVIVWDALSGEILTEFTGHNAPVTSVAFHPVEDWIISADETGSVLVWQAITGTPLRRYRAYHRAVTTLAISADGQTMLTGSVDGTIRQWALAIYPQTLQSFASDNRYIPEFTCGQRVSFDLDAVCDDRGNFATRTPMPSEAVAIVEQATVDSNRTPFPTFTPLPPSQIAQIGDNRGEITSGETAVWYYEPQRVGEILDIHGTSGDFNTLLRIFDPNGGLLMENFNHVDVIVPTALLEGVIFEELTPYRIEMTSVSGTGGGDYNLNLQPRLQAPQRPLRVSDNVDSLLEQLQLFNLIPVDVDSTYLGNLDEYEIDLSDGDNFFLFQSLTTEPIANFVIDTTITIEDGTSGDYCGVIFRHDVESPVREWYALQINQGGFIWLEEWTDGWRMKHRVLSSDLIEIDEVENIRFTITNYDNVISLFVDGHEVLLVEDASHTTGSLALVGSTYEDSDEIICQFNDTYVWQLD